MRAVHLPTASRDFQLQHQRVVAPLDTALGPDLFNARTFNNQVKETLTDRIRANGNPTFSTAGLSKDQGRKTTMDTNHRIKTDVVINTVRKFSQNDRVAIATYIILVWYNHS